MSRIMERFRPSVLIVVAAALLMSAAAAQIDDRALALMEGIQAGQDEQIDTVQMVMVMIMHTQGDSEVRTETIVDYVNERAAIESEVSPGMVLTVVVADGQIRMVMDGESIPLPDAMVDAFAGMFDVDPNAALDGIESATYDGVQSYGGLVEGEQVTISGSFLIAGIDDMESARFLFDGDGFLLAALVDSPEGVILSVYDEPMTGSTAVGSNMTMYLETASGYELYASMRFEQVLINEPIPEGTF